MKRRHFRKNCRSKLYVNCRYISVIIEANCFKILIKITIYNFSNNYPERAVEMRAHTSPQQTGQYSFQYHNTLHLFRNLPKEIIGNNTFYYFLMIQKRVNDRNDNIINYIVILSTVFSFTMVRAGDKFKIKVKGKIRK